MDNEYKFPNITKEIEIRMALREHIMNQATLSIERTNKCLKVTAILFVLVMSIMFVV